MTTWEIYVDLFLSPPNASVLNLPLTTLSLVYFAYWGYEFAFSAVLGDLHISIVDKNMTNCSWQWEGRVLMINGLCIGSVYSILPMNAIS